MRQVVADGVIKAGFLVHLVMLALVDFGTLYAIQQSPSHWPHLVGLALVNLVLLPIAALVWRWLRLQARHDEPA